MDKKFQTVSIQLQKKKKKASQCAPETPCVCITLFYSSAVIVLDLQVIFDTDFSGGREDATESRHYQLSCWEPTDLC